MKFVMLVFPAMLFLLPEVSVAQNLVINPGFENNNDCNSVIEYSPSYSTFPSVTDWVSSIYQSTPDYFNACNPPGAGVPLNFIGSQQARTGNGYAGCYVQYWRDTAFSIPIGYFYNEYVTTKLAQPMLAGTQYYVSFYVSLSEGFPGQGIDAIHDFGAHFSLSQLNDSIQYTGGIYSCLNVTAHINNPAGNYLDDTLNWMKIDGVYTAAGDEQWMTIGHFGDSTFPDHIVVRPHSNGMFSYQFTYMYIDDVCVLDMSDPITSFRDTVVCPGLLPVPLQGHVGGVRFQWSNGDTSQYSLISDSGLVWVRTWGECSYYVDTIRVDFLPMDPAITTAADTMICPQSFPVLLTGNPNGVAFSWNTGATTPQIGAMSAGTYWVVATDDDCRQFADTFKIEAVNMLPPDLGPDTFYCTSDDVTLAPNASYSSYLWSTGAITSSISVSTGGIYTVEVTDGCGMVMSDAVDLVFSALPQVGPLSGDSVFCKGRQVLLTANNANDRYLWSTGDTTCCINVNQPGPYFVQVSNQCGASADSINIYFDNCDACYYVPSAFSPNGDGLNDVFKITSLCHLRGFHMLIVNRWGEAIFDSYKVEQGWDGTLHGSPAEVGAYFYMIELYQSNPGGEKIFLKGDVTLIR
jgi:gliding motility-associated-like protein